MNHHWQGLQLEINRTSANNSAVSTDEQRRVWKRVVYGSTSKAPTPFNVMKPSVYNCTDQCGIWCGSEMSPWERLGGGLILRDDGAIHSYGGGYTRSQKLYTLPSGWPQSVERSHPLKGGTPEITLLRSDSDRNSIIIGVTM